MFFSAATYGRIATSKAMGPSYIARGSSPRSAMRQSSAASTVAGILGFTFSFAARIATFGSAMPSYAHAVQHGYRVFQDLRLVVQRRGNGHAAVRDEKELLLARLVVAGENVELAGRAQTAVLVQDGAQKVACVHLALDQDVRAPFAHQLRRGQAQPGRVLLVHEFHAVLRQAGLAHQLLHALRVAYHDDPAESALRHRLGDVYHLVVLRRGYGYGPLGLARTGGVYDVVKASVHSHCPPDFS